jgi:hypothetical protein
MAEVGGDEVVWHFQQVSSPRYYLNAANIKMTDGYMHLVCSDNGF